MNNDRSAASRGQMLLSTLAMLTDTNTYEEEVQ